MTKESDRMIKFYYYFLIIFFLSLIGFIQSCGARYMIKGKVLDLKTKEIIEGAVVAIKWREQSVGLPGLGAPSKVIEEFEAVSDKNGVFEIPNYTFRSYQMGVYKQGYTCWSSSSIFFPDKTNRKQKIERRKNDVSIEDGMIVYLEQLPNLYSKIEHGSYALNVCSDSSNSGGIFYKAMSSEIDEYYKESKKKYLERKKANNYRVIREN